MSTTVYLSVKNLGGVIDQNVIPLINVRNGHLKTWNPIVLGDTWGKMKTSFINSASEKGRGDEIERFKDGVEHWVLPFRNHEQMTQPNPADACVMTSQELKGFEWDIIEDVI